VPAADGAGDGYRCPERTRTSATNPRMLNAQRTGSHTPELRDTRRAARAVLSFRVS